MRRSPPPNPPRKIIRLQLNSSTANWHAPTAELEQLALYDHLTGLPNRSLIQDRIQQALFAATREHISSPSSCSIWISSKTSTTRSGHQLGDQLLKAVGERFNAVLRKTDTVGRLGGDEFAVIIPTPIPRPPYASPTSCSPPWRRRYVSRTTPCPSTPAWASPCIRNTAWMCLIAQAC